MSYEKQIPDSGVAVPYSEELVLAEDTRTDSSPSITWCADEAKQIKVDLFMFSTADREPTAFRFAIFENETGGN